MHSSPTIPQMFEKTLSVVADKGYPSLRIQLQYSLLLPFSIDPSVDFNQVVQLLEICAPEQDHPGSNEDEELDNREGQLKVEVESSLSKIRLPGRSDFTKDGGKEEKFGWVAERVRDWFTMNAINLSLESVCDLTGPSGSSFPDPVFFFVKPLRLPNRTTSGAPVTKPRAILQKIHIRIQWDHRAQPRTKKRKTRETKDKKGKRGKLKDKGAEGNNEGEVRVVKAEEPEWDAWPRTTSPERQVEEDLVKQEQDNHMIMVQEIFNTRRGFLCGGYSPKVPPSIIRTFDRALYKLIRIHLHRSFPLIFNQRDTRDRALEIPMFRSVARSMLGIVERAGVPFRQEAKGLFKNIQAAHQTQKSSVEQAISNLKLGSDSESDADSNESGGDRALTVSSFESEISEVLCKISLGLKPPRTVQLTAPPLPTDSICRSAYEVENDGSCFKAERDEGIGSISDFDSDSDSDSDSISDLDLALSSGWAVAPLLDRRFSVDSENGELANSRIKEEVMEADIRNGISVKIEEDDDEWGPGLYCLSEKPCESNDAIPKVEVGSRLDESGMDILVENTIKTLGSTVGDLPADSPSWVPPAVMPVKTEDYLVHPINFRPAEETGEKKVDAILRRSSSVVGVPESECGDSEVSSDRDRDENENENENETDGEDEDDGIDWAWSN